MTAPGSPPESASPTPSSSPAKGAARITIPPKKRRPLRGHAKGGPGGLSRIQQDVAVLRAEGMSQATVSKTLDLHKSYVSDICQMPVVAARIQELRDVYTRIAHEKITGLAEKAWDMAGESVEQRDAKAFDSTVRGLVGMERISASVAGVAQRVDVSGAPVPVVDLKVLIANLLSTGP